ncbi:GPI-GlcNAc transferase complex, PIG-H component-domain-containing protein [Abortiporus biennis]|nr:GPI-GlcNAc transferase complex, PIG-H component-domain-containing protein [Abortiporus biennis]
MRRTQPLDDHPQFVVLEFPSHTEFRVENWRLARDGSSKVLKFYGWSSLDAVVPVIVAYTWSWIIVSSLNKLIFTVAIIFYLYTKCTQILWESVIVIPALGIQLETHRGLPGIPLTVSRHFIPLSSIQDVFINEGLRRWDVRYYLAIIQTSHPQSFHLRVAYENILPYFPVLLEVYHGVQNILFESP